MIGFTVAGIIALWYVGYFLTFYLGVCADAAVGVREKWSGGSWVLVLLFWPVFLPILLGITVARGYSIYREIDK